MVAIGVGKLELLDIEYDRLIESECFVKTKYGDWIYDDKAAKTQIGKYVDSGVFSEEALNLTRTQTELFVYSQMVFEYLKSEMLYSGWREVSRRIAIVLHGDRNRADNIHKSMMRIKKKLEGDDE
jgi:hypothetical protein